jgi:hypothetical protein
MKKLIVSLQKLECSGFVAMSFIEFGALKISEVLEYEKIVFVYFYGFSNKEASLVNSTSGMNIETYMLCPNPDECMEKFNVLNINNSKRKLQFVPDLPVLT